MIRVGLFLLFPPIIMAAGVIGTILSCFFFDNSFIAFLIGYIVLLFTSIHIISKVYKATIFDIDRNRVSYTLNYFFSKRKEVFLKNIKEVELEIGVLQRFFGLGTIVIHTQASSAGNKKTGLSIFDIENPHEYYELLSENISNAEK